MSCLDDIWRRQKTVKLGDDIRRSVDLMPWILNENVAKTGCMALLATLLRYWVLLLDGLYAAAYATKQKEESLLDFSRQASTTLP